MDWQPIETAPRMRGARVLGWCCFPAGTECRIVDLRGFDPETGKAEWYYGSISQNITHWMPLPLPPGKENE